VFSLDSVNEVPAVPGTKRRATLDDRDIVIEWMLDFAAEALPRASQDVERLIELTRRRLGGASEAAFWLWEVDGASVAITGQSGPTGTGIRINGVYTPPTMRRNGYASSLVASQSRWLLDNGTGSASCTPALGTRHRTRSTDAWDTARSQNRRCTSSAAATIQSLAVDGKTPEPKTNRQRIFRSVIVHVFTGHRTPVRSTMLT
jgi:GNAT superfamily N-acetyltransferase